MPNDWIRYGKILDKFQTNKAFWQRYVYLEGAERFKKYNLTHRQ